MREIFEHYVGKFGTPSDSYFKDTFTDPRFVLLSWYDGPVHALAWWDGKLYELRDATTEDVYLCGVEWIARPLEGGWEDVGSAIQEMGEIFECQATLRFIRAVVEGGGEQWSTIPFDPKKDGFVLGSDTSPA